MNRFARLAAAFLIVLAFAAASAAQEPVNLNTASADQLQALGLSAEVVERVLAYRTVLGPFKAPEEIGNVKGVGKATLAKVLPAVGVGDGTTVTREQTALTEAEILRVGRHVLVAGGAKIDLNTAGPDELAKLPGFGLSMARKVIAYREANGAFAAIEGLRAIPGVGESKFEKIREFIGVGDGKTIKRLADFATASQKLATADSGEVRLAPSVKGDGKLHVTFIDVGQGDSVLVVTPGGYTLLVDAGEKPYGKQAVLPALAAAGVAALNYLVVTHPHSDHLGGVAAVLKELPVGQVYDCGYPATSNMYATFLKTVEAKRIPYALGRDGTALRLDAGVTARFLHPDKNILSYGTADAGDGDQEGGSPININSSVLKLEFGAFSILLTGDAEGDTEARLLKLHAADLPAKVLKAPHHGSDFSSGPEFLAAIHPEAIVISCGVNNKFNHPGPKALERYAKSGAKVWRTDFSGRLSLVSDGRTYSIAEEYPNGAKPREAGRIAKPGEQVIAVKIDLNAATEAELTGVPGVGDKMARRIIDYRTANGPFKTVDDLGNVPMVGPKILAKLRPNVTVDGK